MLSGIPHPCTHVHSHRFDVYCIKYYRKTKYQTLKFDTYFYTICGRARALFRHVGNILLPMYKKDFIDRLIEVGVVDMT